MHNPILLVLILFPFVCINALDRSTRPYFIKSVDLPIDSLPSTTLAAANNTRSLPEADPLPIAAAEAIAPQTKSSVPANNNTQAHDVSTSPPASSSNSSLTVANGNSQTLPPDIPMPEKAATSTCHSGATGKIVMFHDRDCWFAAKILAEGNTSAAQCGNCVLGLYEADKKEMFKPPGPISADIVEDQAMKLLLQCKNNNSPKVSKRDTPSNSSSSSTVNIQLLMGFNEKFKDCPDL